MERTDGPGPHIVVIGGGFAGLTAVRRLARFPVRITLVDRENHHLFQPLLYQVAAAALNPSDIAYPLRAIVRGRENVRVLLAAARKVDLAGRRVELDNGALEYDYLVVATGAHHAYFGHDDWARHAPGLKTVDDALEMRRRILLAYEAAEREADPAAREAWLRFAVVGAGPTGVELAGALAEIGHHALAGEFRSVDTHRVEVLLLEGRERVLPMYPESLSEKARRQLEALGVTVRTRAFVTALDERGLNLGEERIEARTILWAAGVQASSLASTLGVPTDSAGRIVVGPDLSVPGHPEVFVAGDLASVPGVPGVAPAAMQSGRFVAKAIGARLAGREPGAFRYVDKGSLATIGRSSAVADFGRVRLSGFAAWMGWLLIHIFFLVGFRNRLWVLAGWTWSYITFRRGARLITQRGRHGELPRVG